MLKKRKTIFNKFIDTSLDRYPLARHFNRKNIKQCYLTLILNKHGDSFESIVLYTDKTTMELWYCNEHNSNIDLKGFKQTLPWVHETVFYL